MKEDHNFSVICYMTSMDILAPRFVCEYSNCWAVSVWYTAEMTPRLTASTHLAENDSMYN